MKFCFINCHNKGRNDPSKQVDIFLLINFNQHINVHFAKETYLVGFKLGFGVWCLFTKENIPFIKYSSPGQLKYCDTQAFLALSRKIRKTKVRVMIVSHLVEFSRRCKFKGKLGFARKQMILEIGQYFSDIQQCSNKYPENSSG